MDGGIKSASRQNEGIAAGGRCHDMRMLRAKRRSRGINQRLAKVGEHGDLQAAAIDGHPADVMGVPFQTSEDLADLTSIAGACGLSRTRLPVLSKSLLSRSASRRAICRLMAPSVNASSAAAQCQVAVTSRGLKSQ